jgi:sporulation protein YtfJ
MSSVPDVRDLFATTLEKMKTLIDVNTVVGEAITTPDGITLIPISKCSFGLGVGGGNYGSAGDQFGGGSGAGVSVLPIGFLIIDAQGVRLLPVNPPASGSVERAVEMVPSLIDKIAGYFKKDKQDSKL